MDAAVSSSPVLPALAPPPGSRVAVVGGAGGIGRALVTALAGAGCSVAVLDLSVSLDRHGAGPAEHALTLDVTDEAAVSAAFARLDAGWNGLDGLVNLAGFAAPRSPVADTAKTVWDDVLDANLGGTFLCARAALPLLRRGRAPAMVNTASGLALKPTPGYGPYSAAKAGVLALTRLLAQENAPAIRVNAVAPSAVETAFLTGGTGRGGDEANDARLDLAAYVKTVPLARLAQPEDVVGPILFLLGPAAAYVTGQTLHVNGGLLMP